MRWRVAACLLLPLGVQAVELNHASQAEIETVKGVGPAVSQRLVDERARGPFAGWVDLQHRVPGIGAATARRWSAQGLTVAGQAYAPALSASAASGASR